MQNMQRWLFETPWWLLIAIGVAAVALLLSGNNRQSRPRKFAGLGVLVGGAALWATSFFVETPREIAVRQTHQAIGAVVAKDRPTLDALLHSKAALMGWGRDQILTGAIDYADRYALNAAHVTSIHGEPADSIVTVTVSLISRHDPKSAVMEAVPSTWELKWMDTSQGWKLKEIVPIRIFQTDRSQLPGNVFGR